MKLVLLFTEVKRAYKLAGKPRATETRIHEGPHKVDNRAAMQWLTVWLKSAE
jgi:hypothetical protein